MERHDRQWETEETDLVEALERTVRAMDRDALEYVLIGGIASSVLGRPRWTHDIDLFVRPEHALRALEALASADMTTEMTDHGWLFKAFHGTVLVDVVFRSTGDIYVDDEMIARASPQLFKGVCVPVVAPEDLVVIKALVHDEHNPRHWHDALAVLATCELDWDYLLQRARHGPRRMLSLLLYAQSNDLPVSRSAVQELWTQMVEC